MEEASSSDEDINWEILRDVDWEEVSAKAKQDAAQKKPIYEKLEYDIHGLHLKVKQQRQLGIGFQMWPAGLVLAEYCMLLAQQPVADRSINQPESAIATNWWHGKKVLEVGAGLGLPGMCAASLGAKVTLTDLAEVLPILKYNVEANPHVSHNCMTEPLAWGTEDGVRLGKFDVILGADVIYWERLFPLLIKTLEDTSDDSTVILIAWLKRRARDKGFFRLAKKSFVCEPIRIDFDVTVCTSKEALKKMNLLRLSRRPKKQS